MTRFGTPLARAPEFSPIFPSFRDSECARPGASLFKNWKFKERFGIEFRFRVDNVLNRASQHCPGGQP